MASISNTLTDQTLISGQAGSFFFFLFYFILPSFSSLYFYLIFFKKNWIEISIPAFLQIDPESSVRKEEMIYCGKHSEVYKGVIVDPNLKQKFPDQNVAMKRIFGNYFSFFLKKNIFHWVEFKSKLKNHSDRPGISNDESTLLFKLEIAAMWYHHHHYYHRLNSNNKSKK